MGFLDAMKGANNNWGNAVGAFGVGYIGPKNLANNTAHELMISGSTLKDPIVFTVDDVQSITMVAAAGQWIKFKLCLKNGFEAVLTFLVVTQGQKGMELSMGYQNFESWMINKLYQ